MRKTERRDQRGTYGALFGVVAVLTASMTSEMALAEDKMAALMAIPEHDVAAMSQAVSQAGWTFTVRDNWVTKFLRAGGSIDSVTGYKPPLGWAPPAGPKMGAMSMELPSHFDWRDQVPGAFEPARNQGSCGSCWAFATTGTVETAYAIFYPGKKIDLAEQQILDCSGAGSCGGGYYDALDYARSTGVPDEAQNPYTARDTRCKSSAQPVAKIASWQYVGDGEPTTEEIKAAIYQYGPVSVTVNGSFSSYSGGVYNRCNYSGTNHMVMLVGWDDKEQYWIMRNSWGTSWGEAGYMRIKWEGSPGRKCNRVGETAAYVVFEK